MMTNMCECNCCKKYGPGLVDMNSARKQPEPVSSWPEHQKRAMEDWAKQVIASTRKITKEE